MLHAMYLIAVALAVSALGSAAEPVAQITSADPFSLRGKHVQVAGVPSWSALAGDEIIAGSSSLALVFRDGSRATIASASKVRVERSEDNQVLVRLLSGVMTLRPAARPTVAFFNGSNALKAQPAQELTVSSGSAGELARRVPPPPPPSTPRPTSTR